MVENVISGENIKDIRSKTAAGRFAWIANLLSFIPFGSDIGVVFLKIKEKFGKVKR